MSREQHLRQGDDAVKRVLVRGAEISYAEHGAGDPILFVHGSLSDFRTWNNQVGFFSQFGRAIACSLRYHYCSRSHSLSRLHSAGWTSYHRPVAAPVG